MGVVVPFQDIVRARRREEERACAERCIELIESALPEERLLYARRVRHLSELLEYAVQTL